MSRLDFTLNTYSAILSALSSHPFQRYDEFCTAPAAQGIVLRHDVDALPQHALRFAQMQHRLGIQGTYYFRIVPASLHPEVMGKIADLGHEIGYHYEDVTLAAAAMGADKKSIKEPERFREQLLERAIESFATNLAVLRRHADIRTICMHGSPLSKWDSRMLWSRYDYRDFGLIGEPYFDTDFTRVAYYTDTGRRWDGDKSIIRDRPVKTTGGWSNSGRIQQSNTAGIRLAQIQPFPRFRTTFDIIQAARDGRLPGRMMFTFHPQRWHDQWRPWLRELVWQQTKNAVKYGLGAWRGRKGADTALRDARKAIGTPESSLPAGEKSR